MKLSEMEAIASKATDAPWEGCYHLRSMECDASCKCGYRGGIWGDGEFMVCEMGSTPMKGYEGLEPRRYKRESELNNAAFISMARNNFDKLLAVAKAVKELPFGESLALPWCLESFPRLKKALEELEKE